VGRGGRRGENMPCSIALWELKRRGLGGLRLLKRIKNVSWEDETLPRLTVSEPLSARQEGGSGEIQKIEPPTLKTEKGRGQKSKGPFNKIEGFGERWTGRKNRADPKRKLSRGSIFGTGEPFTGNRAACILRNLLGGKGYLTSGKNQQNSSPGRGKARGLTMFLTKPSDKNRV